MHVTAGAERKAGARDDDHAHVRIAASFFQCLGQISPHVANKSIEPVRPIQCDGYDAGIFGDFNEFV